MTALTLRTVRLAPEAIYRPASRDAGPAARAGVCGRSSRDFRPHSVMPEGSREPDRRRRLRASVRRHAHSSLKLMNNPRRASVDITDRPVEPPNPSARSVSATPASKPPAGVCAHQRPRHEFPIGNFARLAVTSRSVSDALNYDARPAPKLAPMMLLAAIARNYSRSPAASSVPAKYAPLLRMTLS